MNDVSIAEIAAGVHGDDEGIFRPHNVSDVSYPAEAHLELSVVEDQSFWFSHRSECLIASMQQYPPSGPLLDVGGGRGYVTRSLRCAGFDAILLEPDSAAVAVAAERGLAPIICATLDDAEVREGSVHAAGAFDVIEHIKDDEAFVAQLHDVLRSGGRLYATVPAHPFLWSDEDEYAGHYRRYTARTFGRLLEDAGFEVELMTEIFGFLVPPVALLRVLPSKFGKYERRTASDHKPSPLVRVFRPFMQREVVRIARGRAHRVGTSILAVARAR